MSPLVTGIGSLPYPDPEEALDLIFNYCPEVPFWPQLPKRDAREGMVAQFLQGMPCLGIKDKGLFFDPSRKDQELEKFYGHILEEDLDYFKITPEYAAGLYGFYQRLQHFDLKGIKYLKCHLTGPFTFAASFKGASGAALLYDSVFMQAIIKGLAMKASWQIKLFQEFAKPIILFIDEPYLGCFGSGFTPVTREAVVRGLKDFTETINPQAALLGVHCCGNTDWSIFTDVPGIKVINFDAFSYQDKFVLYAENLAGFLVQGGMICWGIAPTQEYDGTQAPQELVERLNQGLNRLISRGIAEDLLRAKMILSPACGLGSLDSARAEGIFRLLTQAAALA
jgi:methionine synthase II (cobalamin-independent)